jgi:hypothetical protein
LTEGSRGMRRFALLAGSLALAACSSASSGAAQLVLNDPYWDRVNVEIVITRRADCDSHDAGYISTRTLVMHKDTTEKFDVPTGADVCWRHDRNPNNPAPGAWSGWTRATLPPGQTTETDL